MADEPVPYTRFVLVGHGRSGSTVVTEGFRTHPNIRMYGEVFHEDPHERAVAMGGDPPYFEGNDGGWFVREMLFKERWWDDLQAVGFKLFANHARTGWAARAWDQLARDRSVHVVRLARDDLLRTYLSFELATRTDEWALPAGRQSEHMRVPPFRADPAACEAFFHEIRAQQEWAKTVFADHPAVDIEYERDVCRRFEKTMWMLYEFLDVPPIRCRPVLEKQGGRHPREQLSNFDELRRHFRGTQFERFFEDDGD